MTSPKTRSPDGTARRASGATVLRLPLMDSDAAIVASLRAGESAGGSSLYDQHNGYVRRVLLRVLGPDAELHDLIQDVFVEAIDSIDRLERPDSLRAWLATIAVHCAHAELRRRSQRRWYSLSPDGELPAVEAPAQSPEVDEALRATYRVFSKLAPDERIPLALRYIEGMDLTELAQVCRVSIATAKRRIARARKKFVTIAQTCPELRDWLPEAEQ